MTGLLTPDQAAAYLGVTRRALHGLSAAEGLPFISVSATARGRRYRPSDLDSWIASRRKVCTRIEAAPKGRQKPSPAIPSFPGIPAERPAYRRSNL